MEVTKHVEHYLCSRRPEQKATGPLYKAHSSHILTNPRTQILLSHTVTILLVLNAEALTALKASDYSRYCPHAQAQLRLLRNGYRAASTNLHVVVVPSGLCCQEVAGSS
jgi:purine-cytosine permease-like protein